MAATVPPCTCGHTMADHTDGAGPCHEPTHRCQCPLYTELCPICRHAKTTHDGLNGQCTITIQSTKEPCGCPHYITAPTP